ncbi:MAG: thioredoxin [Anaerolineae bacterium]
MGQVLRLTDANFEREVLGAGIPVLVDFWASWCPPCKMVEPVIAELATEYDGQLKVGKLNVDQNPRVAARYHILGVPTFMVFSAGEVVEQRTGAQSKAQLEELLRDALTNAESDGADAAGQDIDEEEEILARLRALGYAD